MWEITCQTTEYLNKMEAIQKKILKLIDANEKDVQEIKYQKLLQLLDNLQIKENKYELSSFFHLLTKIFDNHHHQLDFINYVENIITYYINDIRKFYSNGEIFTIFKRNKRILLFLFKLKMIIVDDFVLRRLKKEKYCYYFYPEVKQYLDDETIIKISNQINDEIIENFEYKRLLGENESYICDLIRNDSIEEFVTFINKNNISFSKKINNSIFETNSFLIKMKDVKLIEYAAFFGSIQIFKYLLFNNVSLEPEMWLYAIHGKNAEIIHILEENHINPNDESYIKCFKESIKCHHIDIANYIQINFLQINCEKKIDDDFKNRLQNIRLQQFSPIKYCLKYYNFIFINKYDKKIHWHSKDIINLCKYDYAKIVEILLKSGININTKSGIECNIKI